MIKPKRWKLQTENSLLTKGLSQKLKISERLAKVLVQRNISTYSAAQQFLAPALKDLHDPFLMKGMQEAVEIVEENLKPNKKILLFGDYDVDGICAAAMMYLFLQPFSSSLKVYIPNRLKEGYGLSKKAVDWAVSQKINLIFTLDCGINAHEAIAYAKEKNIQVIISDHHLPSQNLPVADAILNPLQKEDSYPFKGLCGTGVAFKFIQAWAKQRRIPKEKIYPYLDLVALATACDIVSVRGENRIFLSYGLALITQRKRESLNRLLTHANVDRAKRLSVSDLVFKIGPQINAAGRMGDPMQAFYLLISTHKKTIEEKAQKLFVQNENRKLLTKQYLQEARTMLQDIPLTQRVIVLYNEKWSIGLLGILAAKIAEEYGRPTIVLCKSGAILKGSARSVSGFNMMTALAQTSSLLSSYGGHRYAAGLAIKKEQLKSFSQLIEQIAQKSSKPSTFSPLLVIADKLEEGEFSENLWKEMERLAPFGPQNRRPIFYSKVKIYPNSKRVLKKEHLSFKIKNSNDFSVKAIGFNMANHLKEDTDTLQVCYCLARNTWQGKTTLQLDLKDISS